MNHEQTSQILALASSAGPDTDHASILRELAKMATADELEQIATGGCSPETRSVLFAAAALARE
jgi:hypothetical protein